MKLFILRNLLLTAWLCISATAWAQQQTTWTASQASYAAGQTISGSENGIMVMTLGNDNSWTYHANRQGIYTNSSQTPTLSKNIPTAGGYVILQPSQTVNLSLSTYSSQTNCNLVMYDEEGKKLKDFRQKANCTNDFGTLEAGKKYYVYGTNFKKAGDLEFVFFKAFTATVLEKVSYTLNFTYNGKTIGSETGESYVGLKVKPSITGLWNQDNTQKYIVENSDATYEITNETRTFNVSLRKAEENATATLNAVDERGNFLDEIATRTGIEGETTEFYFPLMLKINDMYYRTDETSFVKSTTFSEGEEASVVYRPAPEVIFFSEAESSSATNSAYSSGNTGYVEGQNNLANGLSLGTIEPGVYSVYTYISYIRNGRGLNLRKDGQKIVNFTDGLSNGYVNQLKSVENIIITENSKLVVNGNIQSNGVKTSQSADFDYIYIVQAKDFGAVSDPTIEIAKVDGTKRTLCIEGGISDQESTVTTWYSLDNGETWYSTDNPAQTGSTGLVGISGDNSDISFNNQPGKEFLTFDASTESTQKVLAKSSVTVEYEGQTFNIESATVEFDVNYGQTWTLTGGFNVTDMVKDNDASHTGGNGYGNGYGYYTPKIRVYVNTGILPEADKDKLNVSLAYLPYEYGSCTTREEKTVTLTKGNEEADGRTYYTLPDDGIIMESGVYTLNINADGYIGGTVSNSLYRGKYKVTFKTIDFSEANAVDNFTNDEDGGYNGTWVKYDDCKDLSAFSAWNSTGYTDYWWNYYNKKSGTATMKDITSCKSSGSRQTYNFRLVQTSTVNPLILRVGHGLVKNVNKPWTYKCAQAHISDGNEIGLLVYNTGTDNDANDDVYNYQIPRITDKNIPEIGYSVPVAAAVKQYMVFTPVDVKTVTDCGLSTYCSYYGTYLPADKYLDNDENYGAYYTGGRTNYGTDYYLNRVWDVEARTPLLVAHNNYYKKNVWEVEQQGMEATIEFRIIKGGKKPSGTNELMGYLSDNDIRNDLPCTEDGKSDGGYYVVPATGVYKWDNVTKTGDFNEEAPNLILHNGTTYGVECVNFYSMANSTDKARIYSRSAWLTMFYSNYNDYDFSTDNGVKFFFGNVGENDNTLEEATDIRQPETNSEHRMLNDNAFYTLSGQKLTKPNSPGIYIHNGKKIYVK